MHNKISRDRGVLMQIQFGHRERVLSRIDFMKRAHICIVKEVKDNTFLVCMRGRGEEVV